MISKFTITIFILTLSLHTFGQFNCEKGTSPLTQNPLDSISKTITPVDCLLEHEFDNDNIDLCFCSKEQEKKEYPLESLNQFIPQEKFKKEISHNTISSLEIIAMNILRYENSTLPKECSLNEFKKNAKNNPILLKGLEKMNQEILGIYSPRSSTGNNNFCPKKDSNGNKLTGVYPTNNFIKIQSRVNLHFIKQAIKDYNSIPESTREKTLVNHIHKVYKEGHPLKKIFNDQKESDKTILLTLQDPNLTEGNVSQILKKQQETVTAPLKEACTNLARETKNINQSQEVAPGNITQWKKDVLFSSTPSDANCSKTCSDESNQEECVINCEQEKELINIVQNNKQIALMCTQKEKKKGQTSYDKIKDIKEKNVSRIYSDDTSSNDSPINTLSKDATEQVCHSLPLERLESEIQNNCQGKKAEDTKCIYMKAAQEVFAEENERSTAIAKKIIAKEIQKKNKTISKKDLDVKVEKEFQKSKRSGDYNIFKYSSPPKSISNFANIAPKLPSTAPKAQVVQGPSASPPKAVPVQLSSTAPKAVVVAKATTASFENSPTFKNASRNDPGNRAIPVATVASPPQRGQQQASKETNPVSRDVSNNPPSRSLEDIYRESEISAGIKEQIDKRTVNNSPTENNDNGQIDLGKQYQNAYESRYGKSNQNTVVKKSTSTSTGGNRFTGNSDKWNSQEKLYKEYNRALGSANTEKKEMEKKHQGMRDIVNSSGLKFEDVPKALKSAVYGSVPAAKMSDSSVGGGASSNVSDDGPSSRQVNNNSRSPASTRSGIGLFTGSRDLNELEIPEFKTSYDIKSALINFARKNPDQASSLFDEIESNSEGKKSKPFILKAMIQGKPVKVKVRKKRTQSGKIKYIVQHLDLQNENDKDLKDFYSKVTRAFSSQDLITSLQLIKQVHQGGNSQYDQLFPN